MKFQLAIWGIVCCVLAGGVSLVKAQSSIDYVNMFIGSTGSHNTEYGGTTPAVSEPFGMTQWCAATRINGISRTAYNYNDTHLLGFVATHQPAIWMGDYGFFTLMPQVGILNLEPEKRAVKIDHAQEIATPYYYKISYNDVQGHALKTEFTATSRCSFSASIILLPRKLFYFWRLVGKKRGDLLKSFQTNRRFEFVTRKGMIVI